MALFKLLPREEQYFSLFTQMTSYMNDAARTLVEMLAHEDGDYEEYVQRIKSIEHACDDLTHSVSTRLNQSFITPFDREDIHRLASSLDDVLDFMNAATVRLVMYKIMEPPPVSAELAGLIVLQTEELAQGVSLLEKNGQVLKHCDEVNRLEDVADHVSRKAIADLFEHEKDPIHLIKIKELYEVLETATDKAEDAANVLEAIVLKSA